MRSPFPEGGRRARGAVMVGIAPLLPMKVHRGVARVLVCGPGRVTSSGFKALQAPPHVGVNQCAVYYEMLVGQQV